MDIPDTIIYCIQRQNATSLARVNRPYVLPAHYAPCNFVQLKAVDSDSREDPAFDPAERP